MTIIFYYNCTQYHRLAERKATDCLESEIIGSYSLTYYTIYLDDPESLGGPVPAALLSQQLILHRPCCHRFNQGELLRHNGTEDPGIKNLNNKRNARLVHHFLLALLPALPPDNAFLE